MTRCFIASFLILVACSSIYVNVNGSSIFGLDTSKCVFPFTYNNKVYNNCTTDGDNGETPWCSITANYSGIFAYCQNYRNSSVKCLPTYTVNGKSYTGCNLLSKSQLYKQCKTNNTDYPTLYCPDALNKTSNKSFTIDPNCDSSYKNLSSTHTCCYVPSDYAIPVPLTDDQKQAILDVHNDYRSAVKSEYMFKLYWDDELAKISQCRANLCGFDHDLADNRLSPQYKWTNGQNMVMSDESVSSPDSLIDFMLSYEKPLFVYGVGCKPDGSCLHYTQAMISNLTRVGCSQTHCLYPDRLERFVVCNYIQSQYASTYMTPYVPSTVAASHCPSKDVNGLCDCQSTICKFDQYEYLDPNTCTCIPTVKKRSLVKRDIGDQSIEGGKSFIAVSARGQLADGERKKRHAPKGPKVRVGRKVNI